MFSVINTPACNYVLQDSTKTRVRLKMQRIEKSMYGLIGKMIAIPGQRDTLISILLDGSSEMPGCLSYVIAKDPADTDALWITEVWENQESHQASLNMSSIRQAITLGRPLIANFGERYETVPVGGLGINGAAK